MAAILSRASRTSSSVLTRLSPSVALWNRIQNHMHFPQPDLSLPQFSPGSIQTRCQMNAAASTSPFLSNIIRILRTEIEYQTEYAPPAQPASRFNIFNVDERRGEQWIRLTGKSRHNEDIKIEATMFDGCISVPKSGDDTDGENLRLHLSLFVDITKADGSSSLEFVCSAWPDSLQIQKVYVLPQNGLPAAAYTGPKFRNLDSKLQKTLNDYLEERGLTCFGRTKNMKSCATKENFS
ncbi:hypothetical protein V2J09_019182 [Rumex salicifolius]